MTRHAMTIEEARRVVGGSTSEPILSNMIRALRLHPWLNTPEEKARLEAALIVRRQLRKEARR